MVVQPKLFEETVRTSEQIRVVSNGRAVAQPFIKWAGGKRTLVSTILGLAPTEFNRYLEPFLGGGAMALALGRGPMLLNDANWELIVTYDVIKDSLVRLVERLEIHRHNHSEKYFYEIRALNPESLDPIEQAARFIYLNKTCFNGLYRVNKHGQFNVPFGKHLEPSLYDNAVLKAASDALAGAQLYSLDYGIFLREHARPGDFIYLDPPYVPIGAYSDFRRYTKNQFRESDQLKLAKLYNELVEMGTHPILSNSYAPETLELYRNHRIFVVEMKRNINKKGSGRGPVAEILVVPRGT
jgi:DNA adenine methylase